MLNRPENQNIPINNPDKITSWREIALCAQIDYEIFFPEKGEPTTIAKEICQSCDVREQCLAYAIAAREKHGIWGGKLPHERRALWDDPAPEEIDHITSPERSES